MSNKQLRELEEAVNLIQAYVLNNKNHFLFDFWYNQKKRLETEIEQLKKKEETNGSKKNKV
jgi:hypothetical protein